MNIFRKLRRSGLDYPRYPSFLDVLITTQYGRFCHPRAVANICQFSCAVHTHRIMCQSFLSQLHINIRGLNLAYDEASCRNSVALGKEKADVMTRFRPRVARKHQFSHLYHHRHFKDIANPKHGRPSIPQPFNALLGKRIGRCYYWRWQRYAFSTRSYPSTPHTCIIFQHSSSV